jgi:hypothetical protein
MLRVAPDPETLAGDRRSRTRLGWPHRPLRRRASAALAVPAALLLTGCLSRGQPPAGPHPVPTSAAECNDLPAVHGDPGVLMGTDWSDERHAWGDTVVVYVCVVPDGEEWVRLTTASHEVEIDPRAVHPGPSSTGVIPFRVTVPRGGTGAVRMHQDGAGVRGDLPGPVVAPDGDGWHFIPHPG